MRASVLILADSTLELDDVVTRMKRTPGRRCGREVPSMYMTSTFSSVQASTYTFNDLLPVKYLLRNHTIKLPHQRKRNMPPVTPRLERSPYERTLIYGGDYLSLLAAGAWIHSLIGKIGKARGKHTANGPANQYNVHVHMCTALILPSILSSPLVLLPCALFLSHLVAHNYISFISR
ncbi:hypothetical protein ACRALDRAFT_2019713 [Sodiomyces alcalophilus JCM 7366]|uniref:uncharacterized protein n=1 Tax=Sodiomyces alcalophilus JCM 7366 TaxID=591952 RepID=UPI0039B5DC56